MQITITGRHIEVTEALKAYVENRIEKIGNFYDQIIEAQVVLAVEKYRNIADVTLIANGMRVHGKSETEDMYASVDQVLEKLEKQVKKYKARIKRHQPRGMDMSQMYDHHEIIPLEVEDGAEDDLSLGYKIVSRERFDAKPMSVDEAVLQLSLIEDDFLVFTNAQTQKVNVVYGRQDGNYGLIEPVA